MKIAVLSVQGAFIEHEKMLSLLGAQSFEIRQKRDLEQEFDGLVLPGGESTVTVKRNAYGRQLGSFYTEEEVTGVGKNPEVTECTSLHEYFLRICQVHSKL